MATEPMIGAHTKELKESLADALVDIGRLESVVGEAERDPIKLLDSCL